MITFNNTIYWFSHIAEKHWQINHFHCGQLDEVDIRKIAGTDYVILYVEPGNAVIDTGYMTYSFNVYVLDKINESLGPTASGTTGAANTASDGVLFEHPRQGRINAYSENLLILKDVIAEFKQNLYSKSWVDDEVILELPITAEPFTARFNNLLTGWVATLTFQVNNENNLCIAPISYP
jgi:hypothetical protein